MKVPTCLVLLFVTLAVSASEPASKSATSHQPHLKLVWQYESGDIRIAMPTADDPRVAEFNADTIRAAAKYLDDGAVAWMRERACVACHTPGAYMVDRPLLTAQLGKPSEEVRAEFVKSIQTELPPTKDQNGITYYAGAERAIWRAAGLAQWDRHVTGATTADTDRALRSMLQQLSSHGGYYMPDPVEIPYETTDLELTQHAVRAVVDAPGWLAALNDADLVARVERLKQFVREAEPRHDYDRAIRISIATAMPDAVSEVDLTADIAMLRSKQHDDGGWSTRDFSETGNWSAHMTDTVINLIDGLPDAKNPESDAYMTALAICLLRESGTPADDPQLQRAVAWLKREQRTAGHWWMHSLYRGNYHFTTYIATSKAMQALALCGEIPMLTESP